MLKSMTGFGRSEQTQGDRTVLVEVKSLNGKQLEMNLKMPSLLKAYEFDIRNAISEMLLRGSVDCFINVKQNGASKPVSINTDVAKAYYHTIAELSADLKLDTSQVLSALLKLPEVVTPATDVIDDEGWALVKATMQEALANLTSHRAEEGSMLEKELAERIQNIQLQQIEVSKLEPGRLAKKKEGIKKQLEDNIGKENYDENRLEQELIYYIEKLDITEEQVRLTNHCEYFFAMLNETEEAKGKKLGFLLQEVGREINTIGSKAYDATIQKCVVLMKDELEKAKEQVLNVL
ncbi:MAG: YicC/YloC family endoribonuclease [Chitinophagaceae bacterium]